MFELNNTYPLNRLNDFNIKYVSLISKYKGRWVICHHKEKDCWNCPGGGIEAGESPIQAAKRELFEETSTVQADFHPLYIYEILSDSGLSYGIQYYCEIKELKELPDFEMDKIDFVNIPAILHYLFHLQKIVDYNQDNLPLLILLLFLHSLQRNYLILLHILFQLLPL